MQLPRMRVPPQTCSCWIYWLGAGLPFHCTARQLAQWLIIIKKMSLCKKPATNSRDTPLTTEWMKDEMQFITHTFQENCTDKKDNLVHACIHFSWYFFLIFIVCCVEESLIKSCSIWTDFVYVYPIQALLLLKRLLTLLLLWIGHQQK